MHFIASQEASRQQHKIPDPNDPLTFTSTKLDWGCLSHSPHREWLQYYQQLLAIRLREIVPRLNGIRSGRKISHFEVISRHGLSVHWKLGDGALLTLLANLGDGVMEDVQRPQGELIFESMSGLTVELAHHRLPRWSVVWFLDRDSKRRH